MGIEKRCKVGKKERGNRARLTLLLVLLFVFAAHLTGCATFDHFVDGLQSKEEKEKTIRIGIFEPMSGEDKEAGKLEIQGIELAHELYPTVLGKGVELLYADNKSDITVASDAAGKLVEKDVAVVLGSYSSTLSLAGGDVFAQAGIPIIGITCTNPLVTKTNPYYVRVCFVDSFQGNAAAKYVYESLEIEEAAVLTETDNDYASAMAQQFSDKLSALTGNEKAVLCTVDYQKGTSDFSKQLAKIKESGAKIVYFPGNAKDAAAVLKSAGEMGLTFIGTDQWETEEFLQLAGDAAEGAVCTTIYDAGTNLTEMSQVFLEAYAKKYGSEKKPESAVALGFDAYLVALEGIKRAQTPDDGDKIVEEITRIKELPGATGLISLGQEGDPIKPVAINIVKNGEFVHEYTAEPVWGQ